MYNSKLFCRHYNNISYVDFSVELTISSEYADIKPQEEWDDISKEMGYKSIKLTSDGSVTYQMTKAHIPRNKFSELRGGSR